METKYRLRETNSMATTELETSTLNEYQVSKFPQIEHYGYCYFPFQGNPKIATRPHEIFWLAVIPVNYVYPINREADSATVFFTPDIGQRAVTFLPDESTCEQVILVAERFHSIQSRMQTYSYPEFFDIVSTHATQISASDLQLEQSAVNIFDSYQHEEFDTDIAYDFTNALDRLIVANGKPAVRIINNLIKKNVLDNDLISETLKALGRIEDENTKDERYELIMSFIKNETAIIRDGAVSGLSFLDDKKALPQLRMLFEIETVPILKNNIKVAIHGLETY